MDYALWILALATGGIMGYRIAPRETSTEVDQLTEENNRLKEDIAYYKKLTKTLVEENKELRIPK